MELDSLLLPASAAANPSAWSAQRPEPSRLWIRYRPRRWPRAEGLWSDLGMAVMRDGTIASSPASLPEDLLPPPTGAAVDVVYLPPVPLALEEERDRLAAQIATQGTPVVMHRPVGGPGCEGSGRNEACRPPGGASVVDVYDPLQLLISAGWRATLRALAELTPRPEAGLVWPLVPGFSDGEPKTVAAALGAIGFAAIQPLVLDLSPAQRRLLAAEQEAAVYDALFHRPPPAERPWVRALGAAEGPEPFLPRPLPSGAAAGNRRLSGALALVGELWLRTGRSPVAGQALFRAARWVDGTDRDLAALAREGNLSILPELDERACGVIAETASGERYPSLTRELLAEYRSPAATETTEDDREGSVT